LIHLADAQWRLHPIPVSGVIMIARAGEGFRGGADGMHYSFEAATLRITPAALGSVFKLSSTGLRTHRRRRATSRGVQLSNILAAGKLEWRWPSSPR